MKPFITLDGRSRFGRGNSRTSTAHPIREQQNIQTQNQRFARTLRSIGHVLKVAEKDMGTRVADMPTDPAPTTPTHSFLPRQRLPDREQEAYRTVIGWADGLGQKIDRQHALFETHWKGLNSE